MDVYRQAANIIERIQAGTGTAKALCLQKEVQKKKQTYAVVCETIRHKDLLIDVLDKAEFFKFYRKLEEDRNLILVMTYDAVVGKGVNTKQSDAAKAIQDSQKYLKDAYHSCKNHHVIAPREKEKTFDFPRYARVNPLLGMSDEEVFKFVRSRRRAAADDGKAARKAEEDDNDSEDEDDNAEQKPSSAKKGERQHVEYEVDESSPIKWDEHIPSLLMFPPRTDLHAHPLVRRNHIVLQDKSSCLSAAVLMNAVPITRYAADGWTKLKSKDHPFRMPTYVVDGCSAPGNKTTHIAALGKDTGVQIMAIERDEKRCQLLEKRIKQFGASEAVNCVNTDFQSLGSAEREATEAILLDPSCSASGVVSRVDVALGDAEAPEIANERVENLSKLQKNLVQHALLSFDNCWRVVYSTCSIHEQENEEVVRKLLSDERIKAKGWTLSNIMPKTWATRGVRKDGDDDDDETRIPTERCIRCDPNVDKTNGFFVACFDRIPPCEAVKTAVKDDAEELKKKKSQQ